jgi:glutathione transport system substrate-binding protein
VREAINYAINRQALVKVAFAGYATPATGVVPPSTAALSARCCGYVTTTA